MRAILVGGILLAIGGCGIPDFDQEPGPPPVDPDLPPPECDNVERNGNVYNCDILDRCNEQNFEYRLACCDCDPTLCVPDPTCPPDPVNPLPEPPIGLAESCMQCHNGSNANDYAGPGMTNPHAFGPAAFITCSRCHGGNPEGQGREGSHVPAPPQIGDELNLINSQEAYFNYLTRTGLDKYPDYTVNGVTYSALDYIQFMNPGDFRVVTDGRGCGNNGCHYDEHVQWVPGSPLGSDRFYTKSMYSIGATPSVNGDYYQRTDAAYAWRAQVDTEWAGPEDSFTSVPQLYEIPAGIANYGDPTGIYQNPDYNAANLADDRWAADLQGGADTYINQIRTGTELQDVITEAIVGNCADCHAYSSGANNRYADFRSSGCSSCHMEYSMDGRSRSADPNVPKLEPADPDAIAAPERPHIQDHQIRNVARLLPGGGFVRGASDQVCVGCHQGSNRTVLQYWGVRLDQNQDVTNNIQYPANPQNFVNAANDIRFFDPGVNNNTFNGRNADQLLVFEDYDGDNRDDTPEDIHYEMGMGCIDCHGSRDVHNGTAGDATSGKLVSQQDAAVGITCVSCHGDEQYAPTVPCTTYDGQPADCAVDRFGNPLRHVTRDANGDYWLRSRVDGLVHFLPQTYDTIKLNQRDNPLNGQLLYSPVAAYAMGRIGAAENEGPIQINPLLGGDGFSHLDNVNCEGCHSAWTNTCIGCHLTGIYDADPNNYFFNNVDGERVAFTFAADFTYLTPVWFNLQILTDGTVGSSQGGMKLFYKYQDLNGDLSDVFTFTDRNGNGNRPGIDGRDDFPALSHNKMMQHSIRGKVDNNNEGVAYCVKCHITVDGYANYQADYDAFYADYHNNNFADLDYALLQETIGQNTGNQLNAPMYVHMAWGLGTGLMQFDEFGCPNNPLDNANFDQRFYCDNLNDGTVADNFDANATVYNLDSMVELNGRSNASYSRLQREGVDFNGLWRNGASWPNLAGSMGTPDIERFPNPDPNVGVHLDTYYDADANFHVIE
ncbi:MAG: hypothetical protein AAGA48_16310 [Myxococcota bacterium]